MDLLAFDFETYRNDEYTLSKMNTESYIRDPRFEIILVAVKINEAPAFWIMRDRFEEFIEHEVDWENTALVAHHSHFDGAILSWHFNKRPKLWLDTLSMARVVDGPKADNGLFALCKRYNLPPKGDAVVKAKGKHLADFALDELRAYGEYSCGDADNCRALVDIFLPQIPEQTLRLQDLKIRMFTEPVLTGNQKLLADAVSVERTRKAALFAELGIDQGVLSSSNQFAELLTRLGVEVPMKLGKPNKDGTPKPIPAFAKTDPGMQELLEHEDDVIRHLAEARLEAKSTIIETRAERFLGCAQRGLMPVYIKPNGVHTDRGSAGDGMNWMNMTSVNTIRPEMTVLKRAIEAPPGCVIVGADSSQIQARLTAWLAGQQDKVEAFAQGRDVYSEFATKIYRRMVDRKKNKDDFIPGQVGKVGELSFMFGQGWYTAAINFLRGALGAPPIQFKEADMIAMEIDPGRFLNNPRKVQQVETMPSRLALTERLIHCLVTDSIVQRWRTENPHIAGSKQVKGLWKLLETEVIPAMIAGEEYHFGPNGFLYTEKEAIVFPSGSRLRYRSVQRDGDGYSYWDGRARINLYGGSCTNNIIQKLEQEIIGWQMLMVADAGYKVATEVYDSMATVVPVEYAQPCLDFMLQTLKQRPSWAPDLPLAAEGGYAVSYGDVK